MKKIFFPNFQIGIIINIFQIKKKNSLKFKISFDKCL